MKRLYTLGIGTLFRFSPRTPIYEYLGNGRYKLDRWDESEIQVANGNPYVFPLYT